MQVLLCMFSVDCVVFLVRSNNSAHSFTHMTLYNFKCNFQIQCTYLKNAQYFSHLPQIFLNFLKVQITL